MHSDLTCERSGLGFSLSNFASKVYLESGIALPRISQFEQFRDILACLPGPECLYGRKFVNLSNIDGPMNMKVPRFSISESSNWIPILDALVDTDPMVESNPAPEFFLEQFVSLYDGYLELQKNSNDSVYPQHLFCRSMKFSLDCYACENLENSYECVYCSSSENLFFSRNSHGCKESCFLDTCENCSYCLFCFGLVNARYHIFNIEVSREEYERVLEKIALYSPVRLESARERFANFLDSQPLPAFLNGKSVDCAGNHIRQSSSVDPGFFVYGSSECANIFCSFDGEKLLHTAFTGSHVHNSSFGMLLASDVSHSMMTYACKGGLRNCEYCIACEDSEYLFGCVGLKNSKYCILNRAYGEADFFLLRDAIISYLREKANWGNPDIFRCNILPYNCSLADIYMPLGRIQAHLFGNIWNEEVYRFVGSETEGAQGERIICEITGEPFEFSDYEINFSSEFKIAIPQKTPGQRLRERMGTCEIGIPLQRVCPYTGESVSSWYGGKRTVLGNEGFSNYRNSTTD